jgi:zinc transport system substrate-binding protein
MKMRIILFSLLICLTSAFAQSPERPSVHVSSPPKVLVTIKPIHSLVAGVMEGVADPELLMEADASAHTHHLKPSEAAKLHSAQVIVWIGPIYESALHKLVDAVQGSVHLITLSDVSGIHLLPARLFQQPHPEEGCPVEQSPLDQTQCSIPLSDGDTHGDHDHETPGKDGHLWLAPPYAKVIVTRVAEELARLDQRNAPRYLANSQKVIKKLDELNAELIQEMATLKGAKYLTFHDFTQYFDLTYGTTCVGVIRLNPEVEPTAAALQASRQQIAGGVQALFSEPQFESKAIQTLSKDTGVAYAQLDGLGVGLDKGPDLYFDMMRRFAKDMKKTLGQ